MLAKAKFGINTGYNEGKELLESADIRRDAASSNSSGFIP